MNVSTFAFACNPESFLRAGGVDAGMDEGRVRKLCENLRFQTSLKTHESLVLLVVLLYAVMYVIMHPACFLLISIAIASISNRLNISLGQSSDFLVLG